MTTDRPVVGRLAPTPSGMLHLGNICAFAAAWLSVRSQRGTLLYRVEDIDTTRARDHIAVGQQQDLQWLRFDWDHQVAHQSTLTYAAQLMQLSDVTYRCPCTRAAIKQRGGIHDPECKNQGHQQGATRLTLPETTLHFHDGLWGHQHIPLTAHQDPILVRRDGLISYTLAVVTDDIRDGVTEVVRGADLLEATAIQLVLWERLGAKPPTWIHAPLILGGDGRKLSKSHSATEIRALRERGFTREDIWRFVFPWLGITRASSLREALPYQAAQMERGPIEVPPDAY